MPESNDPGLTYTVRRDRFESLRAAEARRSHRISAARLLIFLLAVIAAVAAELRPLAVLPVAALALLVAFFALVIHHGGIRRRERWCAQLRDLNAEGLRRLERDWTGLPARPLPVADPHGIAADLDLFGSPALAQLLGPIGTPRGRETCARWLMEGADAARVAERQEAVKELRLLYESREALAAHGREASSVSGADIDAFLGWAEGTPVRAAGAVVRVLAWVIPAMTVSAIVLGAAGIVPGTLWILPVMIAGVLTARPGRDVRRYFDRAFGREGMFRGYPAMFGVVRDAKPASPLLARLQDALGDGETSAANCMKKLARLMHLADLRHSGTTYGVAQLLLLWDFHVYPAVERWRVRDGGRVREWLGILGEVEALSALATLSHDHPDWAFAEIVTSDAPIVEAEALGHAMLPSARRVDNDVTVGSPGTFLLVTGSNMSGKSTLLRALGQNVMLALAGGPSCARKLRLTPVTLRTSIHVEDSLVQGVSFFMAQLHRLKDVVAAADAAARAGTDPVLYLLDEILAGTNSAERRVAATRVIRHLVDVGAIGAVTTHDLELGDQAELVTAAKPVHFSETVAMEGDDVEMTFDYQLRAGVATSTNALRLMRMVGLE